MSHLSGYAEWVVITVMNQIKNEIQIRDANLDWGKYYEDDKDHEIPSDKVNKTVIAPGSRQSVSSCGRERSSFGTAGDFNLYDGDTKICNVSWHCAEGNNDFRVQSYDPETSPYSVSFFGNNTGPGALGSVTLTVSLQV